MPERASATLRRKELGRRLRELRLGRGLLVRDAAEFLDCSAAKVSRIESGARAVNMGDVQRLFDLYEVPPDERSRLEDVVRDSQQSSWWQTLDVSYSTYIGLEQSASTINEYQPFLVPGLLQTRDYASALIGALVPGLEDSVLQERVDARVERQRIFESEDPPEVQLFVDELAFSRVVGSDLVMAEQIDAMVLALRSSRTHLQVIPIEIGAYPGYPFSFGLLEFPRDEIPPVAYLEQYDGNIYLERPEEISRYQRLLNHLRSAGLPPRESRQRLEGLARRFERGVN